MLRLVSVARSFQHSGWVTARCVEKNNRASWPLIQEKMPCEGARLREVVKVTLKGLSPGFSHLRFHFGWAYVDEFHLNSEVSSNTFGSSLCIQV